MIAALELDLRLERAAQALGYLAVSVPIAVLGVLSLLTLLIGAALSPIGIGLPVVIAGGAACRWLLRLDRQAANALLDAHIRSLPPAPRTTGTPRERSLEMLSDRGLWRAAATLALKPLLVPVLLAAALVPVTLLAGAVLYGVQGVLGTDEVDYFGPWSFGLGVGVLLCALALPAAVITVATLEGLRGLLRSVSRALIAPRLQPDGPVREMLADSLGDRTVAIAYWLPDREVFVDESGHRVDMPDAGSGRTWTAVELEGRRVAAIVHDAALDTSRELVQAAAAASSLAIANERLKADLRARLEELRVSRLRIVEATDATRRRIERDLHDGAQQHLVSLALDLRMLRTRVNDDEVAELVETLSERLATALDELRELARGIHPAVLTERGLGPAIEALAERAAVPVKLDLRVNGRLPERVEAAAYFSVAEALTNVAKYARASQAQVALRQEGEELIVSVSDDGVGGADASAGSGLRGLEDRLAAVGGSLIVDSPQGAGTRVIAALPCSPDGDGEDAASQESPG